jgi:hypothetical protein
MVNRVWQRHFGQGIVATPSDFGHLGEKPTNPELLDWLANYFVEHDWSVKSLHRLIVTSATYRQSALTPTSEIAKAKDPENHLLWRMNVRRLEGEQIRDALLAARENSTAPWAGRVSMCLSRAGPFTQSGFAIAAILY